MTVLILTRSDDAVVPDLVTTALSVLGVDDVVRVDTDHFPDAIALTDTIDGGSLTIAGRSIDLAGISAVWRRRPTPALRVGSDPRTADAVGWQARAAFDAIIALLAEREGVVVVNHPDRERQAEHKPRQLALARRLGFDVPATIVSNDPAAVRQFVATATAAGHRVVTKLLVPLSTTMRGDGPFMYTQTLTDDDVAALDDVAWAPQIFQHRVDKRLDVRVQVMGDVVVAGAIACADDDWRAMTHGTFEPWPIAVELAQRCRQLCRSLGLVTAAVDFAVDDDGRPWFLELNPAGEWGFLERDLDAGVATALARCLVASP